MLFRICKFGNDNAQIRNGCYFQAPYSISFGNNVFINKHCKFYNGYGSEESRVDIGNNVTIGFNCTFITTSHDIGDFVYRADYREFIQNPIVIGDGTWICTNVTVLDDVKIGKGCVICAGAVVTKDIPSNEMWGGVPAHFIKKLD